MIDSDPTTKRILEFLESLGLTKSEFADSIGINRSMVSHLLSGRNKPSLAVVERMALSYPALDLRWLITGEMQVIPEEKPIRNPILESAPAMDSPVQQDVKAESLSDIHDVQPEERLLVLHTDGTYQRYLPRK